MDMNKIYNMDCLEGMKKLPNEQHRFNSNITTLR